VGRDNRPSDGDYFETPGAADPIQQGDIFRDVPFFVGNAVSAPPDVQLLGPLLPLPAVLVSPNWYLVEMQVRSEYLRVGGTVSLAPIGALQSLLGSPAPDPLPDWVLNMRDYDEITQYMYLPPGLAYKDEAVISLASTFAINSKLLDGQRTVRLAKTGTRQLRRKLTMFFGEIDVSINSIS
jgi:hypothetical protein